MIRKVLTGFLLLQTIASFPQSSNILVLQNEKAVGKNFITQKEIKAIEYIFPERIEDSYIDTTSGILTVQLRGLSKNEKWLNNKGSLVLYDLTNKNVKWTKTILLLQK